MRRIVAMLVLLGVVLIEVLRQSHLHLGLSTTNAISLFGNYAVLCGAVLVWYQVRVGIITGRRRATADFLFGPVGSDLFTLERRLGQLLGKPFLMFSENGADAASLLNDKFSPADNTRALRECVVDILNFYERVGMLIVLDVLDEDLMFDDKGFTAVSFFRWTQRYRRQLREQAQARIYGNIETLYEHWDLRLSTDGLHRRRAAGTTPAERLSIVPKEIV